MLLSRTLKQEAQLPTWGVCAPSRTWRPSWPVQLSRARKSVSSGRCASFPECKNAKTTEDLLLGEVLLVQEAGDRGSRHLRGCLPREMPEVARLYRQAPQTIYAGFDPTAASLHIGNLLVLTSLLRWQRAGHQPIALLGNATGQIGDPSHRSDERKKINTEELEGNSRKIRQNIETVFENHRKYLCNENLAGQMKELLVVDNIEWYKDMRVLEFIAEVGRHFRMGTMLGRTSVQNRLNSDSGMSFCEFCYAVFQGYDWWKLFEKHKCRFQLGGSDQMGNIVSGHDLISRLSSSQAFGLTVPLITTSGGRKFGKSAGNAVWLDRKMSSSFQLYQYFMRTTDNDVGRFLKLFTFIEMEEVRDIVRRHREKPEEREAQRILAENVTLMVHGEDGLKSAQRVTAALYSTSLSALSALEPSDFTQSFEGAKTVELQGESGLTMLELALRASCFKTEHDARRIIDAGGFYVNNCRVQNTEEVLVPGVHVLRNNLTILRTGKRTYHIVKWL